MERMERGGFIHTVLHVWQAAFGHRLLLILDFFWQHIRYIVILRSEMACYKKKKITQAMNKNETGVDFIISSSTLSLWDTILQLVGLFLTPNSSQAECNVWATGLRDGLKWLKTASQSCFSEWKCTISLACGSCISVSLWRHALGVLNL